MNGKVVLWLRYFMSLFPCEPELFKPADNGRIEKVLFDGCALARVGNGVGFARQKFDDAFDTFGFILSAGSGAAEFASECTERLNGECL